MMALLGLGAFALAFPAFKQDKQADDMRIVREKLRFISEVMMLTDAESKGFWPVYET